MRYVFVMILAGFCLLAPHGAMAADGHGQEGHGKRSAPGNAAMIGVNQEYMDAMKAMDGPMMEGVMDPDPDTAFVRGMIPHHQGAVAMAKIQLKYGKDPELRKMAQDIIAAQETEIRFMEDWLKKKGRSGK
ncbi:40-residue YVTN family beta-propeller repeat protein (fragment) [uncultured delta proteobacterium]|uniref:40-residue YVTN family beta-propeller repeat protein n=1 Tax=uncultured delta proteobacterium TaxID=34034 RepID=A0A212KBR2_9DELT